MPVSFAARLRRSIQPSRYRSIDDEIDVSFESFRQWRQWQAAHPYIFDAAYADAIARSVIEKGFIEPLTSRLAAADQITHAEGNWRDGLVYKGVSSRMRAVMRLIEMTFDPAHSMNLRIYAPEALTPFALRLRGLFPRFLGSEFGEGGTQRAQLYPIPREDLMALTLPSDTFDLVSSNEVLEHVADQDKALSEICRVLKPGGWHIGTCPLAFKQWRPIRKARLKADRIIHLTEPEYHGHSLVFEIPGWSILSRCKKAGFRKAAMRFVVSKAFGCVAEHVGGIFVLMCQK